MEVIDSSAAALLRRQFPPLRRFVGARLSPGGYLGLHLTIGLPITGLAIFAFIEIADNVEDQDKLAFFDQAILNWLHERAQPSGVAIAEAVTFLGSVAGLSILAAVVALVLAAKKRRLLLIGWIAALVGGLRDWFGSRARVSSNARVTVIDHNRWMDVSFSLIAVGGSPRIGQLTRGLPPTAIKEKDS